MTAIICIGIALNTAGMYLLLQGKGHKQMFNLLLAINLMFDTMFLLFKILILLDPYIDSLITDEYARATYATVAFSGWRLSYILSVLMLVALAHSRYKAVTNPYEGRKIRLYWSVRRKQLLTYLLPAIFLAACFTVPSIFEIFEFHYMNSKSSTTSQNVQTFFSSSNWYNNWYYQIFFNVILKNFILLGLFPFVSLLYFTYCIRKALNKRYTFADYAKYHDDCTERRPCNNPNEMNAVRPGNDINMIRYKNNKASKTLFLLIFIFLLLHSLRFCVSVGAIIIELRQNNISDDRGTPYWLQVVMRLSVMCMVINASINFLVYMWLNSSKVTSTVSFCKPLCLKSQSSPQENEDIA